MHPRRKFAPRYDVRILQAVRELDDGKESIAEVCRRVGARASELGLPRPSYVHLRRLILVERSHREVEQIRREILKEAVENAVVGRYVNPYEVADRIDRVERNRGS